jgi:hypothetical protein
MKRTGKEIISMFKALIKDYNNKGEINKSEKINCYFRILKNIFGLLWCNISAPFIYPIWYLNKKTVCLKLYDETYTWQKIQKMISDNQSMEVKKILKSKSKLWYWLWTYGDISDPLNNGGLPDIHNGKPQANTFWNRYKYSAVRNPRFNYNYMELRTGNIIDRHVSVDTRNWNIVHKSEGIGDSPDGVIFQWMMDDSGRWYFIYEDNNKKSIWYFGWTGLLRNNVGGRFELSYRVTEGTEYKK